MAIIHSDAYIPYADRPAYADLTPIPQADAEGCLVPIMYSAEYADASGIVRALIAKNEHSPRVLEVTEHVIRMNPAHYSVWQYRFDTLVALDADWAAELRLMDEFAQDNLKSYQVWHHRLLCHTRLSPAHPRAEIEFIHTALQLDTKNYHTWAYLHWTYAHFSALETKEGAADENEGPADAVGRTGRISREDWEEELRWVAGLLAEDGRNNSAWAWRFFLAFSRPGADASKGAGETERKYALEMAHKIPHNLSAWNYLRGVHRVLDIPLEASVSAIEPFAAAQADGSTDAASPRPVPLAIEWLADVALERGDAEGAVVRFTELRDTLDVMRASYWNHRIKQASPKTGTPRKAPIDLARPATGTAIAV